jgi:hypothetical protein
MLEFLIAGIISTVLQIRATSTEKYTIKPEVWKRYFGFAAILTDSVAPKPPVKMTFLRRQV